MADWKKLLVENPPASDIASSPSSGKVLKVSSNGTGLEWADDAGGAFSDNGSTASVTDRVVTIQGSSSAIPTLDINPPSSVSGTSYSRIRVQTSGRDLRFNLRNGSSTSDVMTIAYNNRVGIGTTSPNESLEVAGSIRATSSNSYVDVIDTDSSLKMTMRGGDTIGAIGTYSNHPLSIRTNTTERIRITSDGKVGIGTSSPLYQSTHIKINSSGTDGMLGLENAGSGDTSLTFLRSAGVHTWTTGVSNAQGKFIISSQHNLGAPKLTLLNNGNIGVGTTSPSKELTINGTIPTVRLTAGSYTSGVDLLMDTGGTGYLVNRNNGSLKFSTNNTVRATIGSGGNIGIGTESPSAKLHVSGGALHVNSAGSTSQALQVTGQNGQVSIGLKPSDGGNNSVIVGINTLLSLRPNGTSVLNVSSNSGGRVGIGTSSPATVLHTYGSTGLRLESNHQSNTASLQFKSPAGSSNGGDAGGQINVFDSTGSARIQHTMRRVSSASNGDSVGDYPYEWWASNADGGLNFRMKLNRTGLGIGTQNPTEKLQVAGNILLPLDANNTSYKIKLTGDSTGEIYQNSYDAYWSCSLNHYFISRDGFVHRNSDSSKMILFKHDINNNHHIVSNMSDFNFLAGAGDGGFGFRTIGSTTRYVAIQSIRTDQNTSGLKFNTRSSGTDTEKMRITSDGKVGIGTTSPATTLHLDSSSTTELRIQDGTNKVLRIKQQNNGAFFTAETGNSITFTTNGNTQAMHIDTSQQVGIGTTSPRGRLDVLGTSSSQGFYVSNYGGAVYLPTDIGHSGGSGTFDIQVRNYRLGTSTGGDISIYPKHGTNSLGLGTASYQNRIFINGSNGNIGVNNTSPTSTFDVSGTLTVTAQVRSRTGNGLYLNARGSSGGFSHRFQQDGTDKVVIKDSTGYVGIGTTAPEEKLSINNGRIQLSNQYMLTFSDIGDGNSGRVGIQGDEDQDFLRFRTDNANRMAITNAGVGIGTLSPSDKLEVYGDGADTALRIHEDAGTHKAQLHLRSGGHDHKMYITASSFFMTREDVEKFAIHSTSVKIADSLGVGGIPTAKLQVQPNNSDLTSNSALGLWIKGNNAGIKIGRHSGNDGAFTHIYTDVASTDYCYIITNDRTNGGIATDNIGVADGTNQLNNRINFSGTTQSFILSAGTRFKLDANSRISLSNNDSGTSNTVFGKNAGNDLASGGNYSAFFGENAGANITTGDGNVAIGYSALLTADDDGRNVAIGQESLKFYNHSGDTYNVAVGHRSQYSRTGGVQNTALGAFSQYGGISGTAPTGAGNTSVGYSTLHNLTSGTYNSGFGVQAGYNNQTGTQNHIFGYQAGYYNETGSYNTALGGRAMYGASGNSHSNNTAIGYESLKSITTGGNNVAVGKNSLRDMTSGSSNTGIGESALESLTVGTSHTAIGRNALINQETGNYNTAIGVGSFQTSTNTSSNVGLGYIAGRYITGHNNVAIGSGAMDGNSSGSGASNNVGVGYQSLNSITTGGNNVAIGYQSMYNASTGSSNSIIGHQAGVSLTSGTSNVAIGRNALTALNTGTSNVAIGNDALSSLTGTIVGNVGIGYEALKSATSGEKNIAIGFESGKAQTTGYENTYIGYQSGLLSDVGLHNTAIGANAYNDATGDMRSNTVVGANAGGFANATSDNNTVIGAWALRNGTGVMYENVVIGSGACDGLGTNNPNMYRNTFIGRSSGSGTWASGTIQYNTAIGYSTMSQALENAQHNTTLGYSSLYTLTTGNNNTSVGSFSSNKLTTGSSNVALGYKALNTATTASSNVAIGVNAMESIPAGQAVSNSIAIGYEAFKGSGSTTTGANGQVAIGYQALMSITTGGENVALGFRSGNNIDTGDSHVLVGNASGTTLTNGRRCTVVGDESDVSASDALNQTVIGQGATGVQDNSAIIGNSACADVFMGDNGSAWSTTSDGRLKENIEDWSTGLDAINKLRVVEYNFKEDNPYKYDHKKKRQGIIAQEAIEAIPEMIKDDGEWLTANQEPMIWALVNAVQELTKKVNELETKLNKEN